LDFFTATSSSKGVGDNGGVIGMSSSSVRCFATLGKPLSKGKITKRKEACKEEEILRVPV
jgi:hypothetical protein